MAWSYITDLQSSGMRCLIDTESVEEPENTSRNSSETFVTIRHHINRKTAVWTWNPLYIISNGQIYWNTERREASGWTLSLHENRPTHLSFPLNALRTGKTRTAGSCFKSSSKAASPSDQNRPWHADHSVVCRQRAQADALTTMT
jgi:hypothetical protein